MNNFGNVCEEVKKDKTVKSSLEEMGGILKEMGHQVAMIAEAVYKGFERTQGV